MDIELYKKVFDKHNGVIKLSDFTSEGYHNTILNKLRTKGYIDKIKTGYYEWIDDYYVSDAVVIAKLFPEAIICMESALYLYGYTERTPMAWQLAVSKNNKKTKYSIEYPPMQFYYIIDTYMTLGKTEILYENHSVAIFDRERTVCDIMRYEKKMDKEVFNYAVKAYVRDSQKNISRLLDYAEIMNIKNKVNTIIGMWM